jgi:hypothetical protein
MEILKHNFVNFVNETFSKSIPTREEIINHFEIKEGFNISQSQWRYRDEFCKNFSYAIPCIEALEIIKKYEPILEVGAGSGFWSSLISRMGCDVIATDIKKWKFNYKYFDILEMNSVSAVEQFPDRTILTCWPSYGESWAYDFLKIVDKQTVIYIGESAGGCTGCDEFHELLKDSFELIDEYNIPQWYGLHDYLTVYKRKI